MREEVTTKPDAAAPAEGAPAAPAAKEGAPAAPPAKEGEGGARRFRRFSGRRKRCTPCDDLKFDWKDIAFLTRYQTPNGKMMSRKRTGYCAQCQRRLAQAIKRARFMSLIPYVA